MSKFPLRRGQLCILADLNVLKMELQMMGMDVTVEEGTGAVDSNEVSLVQVSKPGKAVVEVRDAEILISTGDKSVALLISQAVSAILDSI